MNSNYLKIAFLLLAITLFGSCKEEENPAVLSSSKEIVDFNIQGLDASINESSKSISLLVDQADVTALQPTITISPMATISPGSGIAHDFTNPVTYKVTAEDGSTATYRATVQSSISSFTFNNKGYEIIKSNKTWAEAAEFAKSRGGYLAEINNLDEQNALFKALENANITKSNTISPDGGNASYIWIGGNDFATEGDWIWDGDNDGSGLQFWRGTQSGSIIDGRYNNWGNEPDDFGPGQDALGMAITDWPLGVAGQWNDIRNTNKLYFLIELK